VRAGRECEQGSAGRARQERERGERAMWQRFGDQRKVVIKILYDYMPRCRARLRGLSPETCGRAVHKPVDNRRDMRITVGILWTTCGPRKNSK
jgi:hypothetical protein